MHFTFNLDRNIWSYQINAKGINEIYRPYGELKIEPEIMELLARFSCRVVGSDWEENLRSIGRTLAKQIFRGTPEFIEAFSKLQMLVRNHEKIRFHFTVEKSVHPVALEAALCEDEEFWMLRAPIYRSLDVSPVVYPLFEGPHDTCKGKRPTNPIFSVTGNSGMIGPTLNRGGHVWRSQEARSKGKSSGNNTFGIGGQAASPKWSIVGNTGSVPRPSGTGKESTRLPGQRCAWWKFPCSTKLHRLVAIRCV